MIQKEFVELKKEYDLTWDKLRDLVKEEKEKIKNMGISFIRYTNDDEFLEDLAKLMNYDFHIPNIINPTEGFKMIKTFDKFSYFINVQLGEYIVLDNKRKEVYVLTEKQLRKELAKRIHKNIKKNDVKINIQKENDNE